MFGTVRFHDIAVKAGIKPLLGFEAYAAPDSRLRKEKRPDEGPSVPAYHLTLLAENDEGLHNLYRLTSFAYTEGFYYKPRIDLELLAKHSRGVIALSGCLKGKIPQLLLQSQVAQDGKFKQMAYDEAAQLVEIFGKERFFLEIQRVGMEEQEVLVPLLLEMSRYFGVRTVATCDSHYTMPEDSVFHEQLVCIAIGKTIHDEDRLKFSGAEFYIKSEGQMLALFKECPEAVHNTQLVADMCTAKIQDKYDYVFPIFSPDDNTLFVQQARIGLRKRELDTNPTYTERLEYEIKTIVEMGFASYFLVVADYVNWARSRGIMVGPGRGSAAGSLVAYSLGITQVDPLEYDLLFQRFLNKGRKSMPDIDLDFCKERRGEVIQYLCEHYGVDHVAQIATFATFKPRGAVKDFTRVQGEPFLLGEQISRLLPPPVRGREPTWKKAIEEVPALLAPEFGNVVKMAQKSEGLVRQSGIHAAGVIITPTPLHDYLPVFLGKNKEIISQWDKDNLERMGLVKMDILGVAALTTITKCLDLIPDSIDLDEIDRNDPVAFELIGRGETSGLFQLDEGGGIRDLCMQLKPKSIKEISVISALYRPGPLDNGVAASYVRRHTCKEETSYLTPELATVLGETHGLLIYQEQAMKIATELAGYTLEEADDLRKAIGKKSAEKMAKEEKRLTEGMVKRGIQPAVAKEIWEEIQRFAEYSFNASHAVAYSFITYQTAWLKAHYPIQFYCALLTMHAGERDKIIGYLGDCRRAGIKVLPPDVNESSTDFTIVGETIRFGLAAIKDVGDNGTKHIVNERKKHGCYKDLLDFYKRLGESRITRKTIEALAKAGAFSSLGLTRRGVIEALDDLTSYQKRLDAYESKLSTFNARLERFKIREQENILLKAEGKKPKGKLTIPTAPEPIPSVTVSTKEEFGDRELQIMEKETLGFYLTGHPLYAYEHELITMTNAHTESLVDCVVGENVSILCMISKVKTIVTKTGKQMAFMGIEDMYGDCEVTIFPRQFEKYSPILEQGKVILLTGTVETKGETRQILANKIEVLPDKIHIIPVVPRKARVVVPSQVVDRCLAISIIEGPIELELLVQLEGTATQILIGEPRKIANDTLQALRTITGVRVDNIG